MVAVFVLLQRISLTSNCMQLTDWMAHLPKEVIAKNFQDDISDWDDIPGDMLYIFPGGACARSPLPSFFYKAAH